MKHIIVKLNFFSWLALNWRFCFARQKLTLLLCKTDIVSIYLSIIYRVFASCTSSTYDILSFDQLSSNLRTSIIYSGAVTLPIVPQLFVAFLCDACGYRRHSINLPWIFVENTLLIRVLSSVTTELRGAPAYAVYLKALRSS